MPHIDYVPNLEIEIPTNLSVEEVFDICKHLGYPRYARYDGKLVISAVGNGGTHTEGEWKMLLQGASIMKRLTVGK
jgi:hypothetical protein